MTPLKKVKDILGSYRAMADAAGVASRATAFTWVVSNRLPRTDYTGETCYAAKLAEAVGYDVTEDELLEGSKPK